jgi:hypothetical protein
VQKEVVDFQDLLVHKAQEVLKEYREPKDRVVLKVLRGQEALRVQQVH